MISQNQTSTLTQKPCGTPCASLYHLNSPSCLQNGSWLPPRNLSKPNHAPLPATQHLSTPLPPPPQPQRPKRSGPCRPWARPLSSPRSHHPAPLLRAPSNPPCPHPSRWTGATPPCSVGSAEWLLLMCSQQSQVCIMSTAQLPCSFPTGNNSMRVYESAPSGPTHIFARVDDDVWTAWEAFPQLIIYYAWTGLAVIFTWQHDGVPCGALKNWW